MRRKDWLFSDEQNICNFRSVGVLARDGKILVQRDEDGTEYALPGGHVNIGETSEQTLVREYKEETGADIVCDRLLWVEESFWKWGRRDAHTIAFYYAISLAEADAIPDTGTFFSQKDNCKVILSWMPVEQLKEVTIYPGFLKDKLAGLGGDLPVEHFVTVESFDVCV